MFGIGMPELLLILIVALVVLGPKKLPELARTLGRALSELKKTAEDLKENLNVDEDWRDISKEIKESINLSAPSPGQEPLPSTGPWSDEDHGEKTPADSIESGEKEEEGR